MVESPALHLCHSSVSTQSCHTILVSIDSPFCRVWVFQAFFRSQLVGHTDFAHEALTRALDFLEWGRKQFANVPKEDRGAIFERSWIRGVKKAHLNLMHQAGFRFYCSAARER